MWLRAVLPCAEVGEEMIGWDMSLVGKPGSEPFASEALPAIAELPTQVRALAGGRGASAASPKATQWR